MQINNTILNNLLAKGELTKKLENIKNWLVIKIYKIKLKDAVQAIEENSLLKLIT